MVGERDASTIWRTLMESTAADPLPDLTRIVTRPWWMERGACAEDDTRVFFPERGQNPNAARRICSVCPVVDYCLDYALEDPDLVGIWAGTTDTERRRIRQERQTPPAA